MFEGEKTTIFWIGLVILGLASAIPFSVLWYAILVTPFYDWNWRFLVPPIAGPIVFVLIGLYMMKSETKKQEGKIQLLNQ
ncbi:hypothetical protein MUO74_09665 [Candidatus Bathyarchaeota archaeon]|nr:hypothetical protein [Candidatus Bathyarchaeota archaeon]